MQRNRNSIDNTKSIRLFLSRAPRPSPRFPDRLLQIRSSAQIPVHNRRGNNSGRCQTQGDDITIRIVLPRPASPFLSGIDIEISGMRSVVRRSVHRIQMQGRRGDHRLERKSRRRRHHLRGRRKESHIGRGIVVGVGHGGWIRRRSSDRHVGRCRKWWRWSITWIHQKQYEETVPRLFLILFFLFWKKREIKVKLRTKKKKKKKKKNSEEVCEGS